MEKKKILLPIPAWLFVAVMTAALEGLVHIWVTDAIVWGRFLALMAFAFGFGALLGLLVSLLPGKAQKWTAVAVALVLVVFYLMQYFLQDAYQTFMPMTTVLAGAGGVAASFGDLVVQLLNRNVLRIALVLAPVALYAVFAQPVAVRWKLWGQIACFCLTFYLLGFFLVNYCTMDAQRMTSAYSFDSAVRAFGVNMAMTLEAIQGGKQDSLEFDVEPEPYIPETTVAAVPGETEVAEAPVIVYDDNVMDFDFAALAETEEDANISSLHSYVASVKPTAKNAYTGLFAGKNLIIITAESFSAEVIDPELTPTLYRLANQGITFTDYYQPLWGGSTSTGEFSVLTGMVAASGISSINEGCQQDLFLTMGNQLQEQGYFSAAYHNHAYTYYERHKTHTTMGYDTFMGMGNGMEAGVADVWPESDLEMMDFTVPQYIDQQPFSIYYMTVSGHANYTNMGGNAQVTKNYPLVEHLDCPEIIKYYLACNLELEKAMASLVGQLEAAGIADDTVIVLTADHYPYALEQSSTWNTDKDYTIDLYGYKYANLVERDHNALIIWSGSIEGMGLQVDSPTFSLDILPTLSNLFGLEYDSRLMVGRDVFSDQEAIVFWPDCSWRTEKGTYVFETDTFTPNPGTEVEEGYVERIQKIVANKIKYSRGVAEYDYFNVLSELLNEE